VRARHVEHGKSGVDPVLPVHGLLTALRARHLEPQSCRAVRLGDGLKLDGYVRTLIHLRTVEDLEVRRDPPCAEDRAFTLWVLLADKFTYA